MELSQVVEALETFAPLRLAESWDNVGLLVEPTRPRPPVRAVLFTNDLTEPVLTEAVERDVQLIVSYHPPIFGGALKRLTNASWKERILVGCIERRIAIYSPHTCWDAAAGGVNDWLTGAFATSSVCPITTSITSGAPTMNSHQVELDIPLDKKTDDRLWEALLRKVNSQDLLVTPSREDQGQFHLRFACQQSFLDEINGLLTGTELFPYLKITKLENLPMPNVGMGRLCKLQSPLTLSEAIQAIKDHLRMKSLRIAVGQGRSLADNEDRFVSKVALCAGSGSSVLRQAPSADLYWTGEMSHHEVLDSVQRGITVVLCEHSNTERGFLQHFAPKLTQMLDSRVDILVSTTDADPLVIA